MYQTCCKAIISCVRQKILKGKTKHHGPYREEREAPIENVQTGKDF